MPLGLARIPDCLGTAVARLRDQHDGPGPGVSIALPVDGLALVVLASVEGVDASDKTWSACLWATAG